MKLYWLAQSVENTEKLMKEKGKKQMKKPE